MTANVTRNRIIKESNSNESTTHHDLTNDYSNGGNIQIVNYLAPDILHHQMLQTIKKLDGNYKDQLHVYEEGDESAIINTQSQIQSSQLLPVLTPIKYNEYQSGIVGDIINEDSEKSDCEGGEHDKTPSKLPHKKRIAKKLISNQPYNHQEQFSILIPNEETNIRNLHTSTVSWKIYYSPVSV